MQCAVFSKEERARQACTQRKEHVRTLWERGHLQVTKRCPGEPTPAQYLHLRLPASRRLRDKFLLFQLLSLWDLVSKALVD